MTMRRLLAASLAAAILCATARVPAWSRDLAVATLDGTELDRLDSVLVQGFAGAGVQARRWSGGLAALRAHVGDGTQPWDVVLLPPADLPPACDQGLVEKLDWSRLGGRDHYLAPAVSDCGVGAVALGTVLAWDRDKLAGTPNWADFWDVVKNPGKRGLRRSVRGNLEIALLADGVAPGDVYRLLRTPDGLDRAFRKLDQLKPYIDWWQTDDEATQILGSGEVLMTSAPALRITAANSAQHRNFGLQWTGSLLSIDAWSIVKGSANRELAYRFLAYAEDPAQQARLAGAGYGWMEKGATGGQAAGLVIDEGFWRDNLAKLTDRFDAWLTAH